MTITLHVMHVHTCTCTCTRILFVAHNDNHAFFSPQSSTSPSYSHLLLLELGIQCPPSAMLKFEVFSVSYSQTDDKDRCHLVSSTQETGAPVSHE